MRRFAAVFPLMLALLLPARGAHAASPTLRALWVDAFHAGIKSPAETTQLVADARRAGANALMVQVRRRGDSYYLDSLEPTAVDLAPGYDPLADLIGQAHRAGLQVHAWTVVLPVWKDGYVQPAAGHVWRTHGPSASGDQNWLMRRDDGRTGDCGAPNDCAYFLDPGHPAAADYTVTVLDHLVKNYDLDGLHLDYLRYPGVRFGYNPVSLRRFQAEAGRGDTPLVDDPQWLQWRRDQVTKLVKRIYLNAVAARPQIQVSLAAIAWGDGPTGDDFHTSAAYSRVLQDWDTWLERGYLDWVLVMNYEAEGQSDQRLWYRSWVDWLRTQHAGRAAVGVGAWLNTADQNLAQLRYALDGGELRGTALYSYALPVSGDRLAFFDRLKAELWADGAGAPTKPAAETGFVLGKLLRDGQPQTNQTVRLSAAGRADLVASTDGSGVFGFVAVAPGGWTLAGGAASAAITVSAGRVTLTNLATSTVDALQPAAADPAFAALWRRTDAAVARGETARSWLWGPAAFATGAEPYRESPGGARTVQYWDKSRMEVTQPAADRAAPWFVTNGLLVRELVSGQQQAGDGTFTSRPAATTPIGGNSDDTSRGPSYNDFAALASLNSDRRSPSAVGQPVLATLDAAGNVGSNAGLARYGVRHSSYSAALGHNLPDVFDDYLATLPLDWVFVMGYPITEPYWARYQVGSTEQDVLVQLFERRTLTYTPANPAAFRVEMGNVGQHYFRWRYGAAPWEGE